MANQTLLRQLLRHHLVEDAGVVALVGANVRGGEQADADAGSPAYPAVSFEFLSGFSRHNRVVAETTVEVYGWSSKSRDEASTVYQAAYDSLQAECLKVTGIDLSALAREVQQPVDVYVDALRVWAVRGRWLISSW